MLSEPISTSSLDALYTHLSSLRDVPAADHHSSSSAGTDTGRAAASSAGVQQLSSSADSTDQDELASAPGYEYHRHISREEAIKVAHALCDEYFCTGAIYVVGVVPNKLLIRRRDYPPPNDVCFVYGVI